MSMQVVNLPVKERLRLRKVLREGSDDVIGLDGDNYYYEVTLHSGDGSYEIRRYTGVERDQGWR
jgi:hypothetical protein